MPRNVLVVDDDPDAREILTEILITLGLEVRQASNGLDALNQIMAEKPDMLILDLSMPHMDGPGVLRQLRDNPDTLELPVLVFTAEPVNELLAERLDHPLDMIMGKGRLSMTDLRNKVQRVLGVG